VTIVAGSAVMTERRDTPVRRDADLLQRAAAYAADVHRDDRRKGTDVPYVSHLWSVAALVLEHGGDDVAAAAALLHDTAEDHGGRRRLTDLRERFGDEIARLVEALSDSLVDTTAGEAKAEWHARKAAYLAHLADADEATALVAACDKLHNARCLLADLRLVGDAVWDRFTTGSAADQLWYHRSVIDRLAPKVPPALADELTRTVEAVAALAGEAR
jgi:GTP pyrophosphokinase